MASSAVETLAAHVCPNIVAHLPTIDLKKLLCNDSEETAKLWQACESFGFMYLELGECGSLMEDWKNVLRVMQMYFDQPLDVKTKDDRKSDTWG